MAPGGGGIHGALVVAEDSSRGRHARGMDGWRRVAQHAQASSDMVNHRSTRKRCRFTSHVTSSTGRDERNNPHSPCQNVQYRTGPVLSGAGTGTGTGNRCSTRRCCLLLPCCPWVLLVAIAAATTTGTTNSTAHYTLCATICAFAVGAATLPTNAVRTPRELGPADDTPPGRQSSSPVFSSYLPRRRRARRRDAPEFFLATLRHVRAARGARIGARRRPGRKRHVDADLVVPAAKSNECHNGREIVQLCARSVRYCYFSPISIYVTVAWARL